MTHWVVAELVSRNPLRSSVPRMHAVAMRPRIWQGGALLVAGVALDGGAAAVFNGRWRPPELLYWFGWPGFLLPGLLASAVGLALLVGRPRGWYDGAAERSTPAATRVASSLAGLILNPPRILVG